MAEDYLGSINSEIGIANSLLLGSRNCWLALSCNLRELYIYHSMMAKWLEEHVKSNVNLRKGSKLGEEIERGWHVTFEGTRTSKNRSDLIGLEPFYFEFHKQISNA